MRGDNAFTNLITSYHLPKVQVRNLTNYDFFSAKG